MMERKIKRKILRLCISNGIEVYCCYSAEGEEHKHDFIVNVPIAYNALWFIRWC